MASNSYGGAISLGESTCEINNCSFTNNTVQIFLDSFLITGDCPSTYGGAIHLEKSNITLTNCSFQNNTGFGDSPEFIITGNGGAFNSYLSKVKFKNCSFNNNTLYYYGYKFDIVSNIKGGACKFLDSKVELEFCQFINNTAMLRVRQKSKYLLTTIIGGAIFFYNCDDPIICTNCEFINNSALIPDKKNNEYAGAIYLTYGKLINCTFYSNAAFNACDIKFYKLKESFLFINNIKFNNSKLNSMIIFQSNDLDKLSVIISTFFFNNSSEISKNFAHADQLPKQNKIIIFGDLLFDQELQKSFEIIMMAFN